MRHWIKLLPFFVVCWLARNYGEQVFIDKRRYARPFGPGQKWAPEAEILIEINPLDRPDWYS